MPKYKVTHIYLKSDKKKHICFKKNKRNELTQGQKKGFSFCSYNATFINEKNKKKKRKKQINIKYLLISKQNKAKQKLNTQLN
jgi:hypothetical protein